MEISDKEFTQFCDFIYSVSGIKLHEGKREMVKSRVGKQVRIRKLGSFREYFELVRQDNSGSELVNLLNIISTNLTYFFREPKHFDFLEKEAISHINNNGNQRVRIWSAGCSTGEEPYTLAMMFNELLAPSIRDWKILATDLSTRVLAIAMRGVYPEERIRNVPLNFISKYFQKGRGDYSDFFIVREELRSRVHFNRINLIEPFPVKGPFDVIFCRNVMIYFNRETQEDLTRRFHDVLRVGGYFFVGHSESLLGIKHGFKYLGPSIYQRQVLVQKLNNQGEPT